jgi:hypothetical protein
MISSAIKIMRYYNILFIGIALVAGFVFVALFANSLAPFDPLEQNTKAVFNRPSLEQITSAEIFSADWYMAHGFRWQSAFFLCFFRWFWVSRWV